MQKTFNSSTTTRLGVLAWDWVLVHKLGYAALVASRYRWTPKDLTINLVAGYCILCFTPKLPKKRRFPTNLEFDETICLQCLKRKRIIIPREWLTAYKGVLYNNNWEKFMVDLQKLPDEWYYETHWVKHRDAFMLFNTLVVTQIKDIVEF